MESHDRGRDVPLDSDKAKQNAQDIENYRLSVMHERWLSTLILTTHIEIEALLVELLRRNLPRPQKLLERKTMRPSFSQKLVTCEALSLFDDDIAEGIWAVNRLRNALAHQLKDVPSLDALARFIAAMSAMHPLQVRAKGATSPKELRTFQQVRSHFLEVDRDEAEQFVFISLLLLRAKVSSLVEVRHTELDGHEQ